MKKNQSVASVLVLCATALSLLAGCGSHSADVSTLAPGAIGANAPATVSATGQLNIIRVTPEAAKVPWAQQQAMMHEKKLENGDILPKPGTP